MSEDVDDIAIEWATCGAYAIPLLVREQCAKVADEGTDKGWDGVEIARGIRALNRGGP